MRKETEAVIHTIIEIAGERLVAQYDLKGELVKTWKAGENSQAVIEKSQNSKVEA